MANTALQPGATTGAGYSYPTMQSYIPQQHVLNGGSSSSVSNFGGFDPVTAGVNAAGNLLGWIHEDIAAKKERQWNEEMMEKQNQWNLEMWNKTNEYNDPKNQVERLRNAGLNPLYYGLDGSSANAMQSAQVLGYDRSSVNGLANPIQAGIDTGMKKSLQDAQIENIEAQTTKIKADTDVSVLDAEFKRKTMDARVEGENLANDLTKVQIDKIEDERSEICERIKNIAQNTKTEAARELLLYAEEKLRTAQAREIVELLPYRKALMAAETQYQKAAACLATWNALYQLDLVRYDYVAKEVELLSERIRHESTEADKAIMEKDILEFKKRVRSGQSIDVDSIPKWMLTDRIAASFWNAILARGSEITEAVGSVVAPVAGYALGKGSAAAAGAKTSTKYTNLYGPDGKPVMTTSY